MLIFYLASVEDEKKLNEAGDAIIAIVIYRKNMRNWITAEGLCSAGNRWLSRNRILSVMSRV